MSLNDQSPRAARQLRNFGRLRAPEDEESGDEGIDDENDHSPSPDETTDEQAPTPAQEAGAFSFNLGSDPANATSSAAQAQAPRVAERRTDERREADERRAAERRGAERRAEEQAAEQQAAEVRENERRAAERRAAERRDDERRAAERRAAERRVAEPPAPATAAAAQPTEPRVAPTAVTEPVIVDPVDLDKPPAASKRKRRREGSDDTVDIGSDTGHAWWAQRDDLDRLIQPKPQGVRARAERAAKAAFSPADAPPPRAERTPPPQAAPPQGPPPRVPQTAPQGAPRASNWDPSAVYSWGSPQQDEPLPPPPPPNAVSTPWDVLGLTSDAPWGDVTRRHKQLAKQHHPDRHGQDNLTERVAAEHTMARINAAFSELRRIYQLTDGI